jgi:tRNA-dihydrouridine synthase
MPQSIEHIRLWYQTAAKEKESAHEFWDHLQEYEGPDGVMMAYKASARAFLASHTWNPLEKLKLLRESMRIFRQAVELQTEHIEIRFLRFAIQTYVPGLFNETDHLDEDKNLVIAGLPHFDTYQLSHPQAISMLEFLMNSGRLSRREKARLTKSMAPHSTDA